ncbi:TolC family outer membrane protein [Bordetella genomosp. 5]|uniref:TolC family outer membrane protein n=1 Tax=Bordetella genomosp. 5 TaxID=1395608 RepID=UPI0014825722|nr:TolC family outer membrane protein [Bordetella genomosp. 5]
MLCAIACLSSPFAHGQDEVSWNPAAARPAGYAVGEVVDVTSLSTVWRDAQSYDPVLRAAASARNAGETERNLGRARLFPQVQGGYVKSQVTGRASQPNFLGQRVGFDLDYDSTSAYLQLQQPLLDYGLYSNYRRGGALADQAQQQFAVQQQQAATRWAQSYFNLVLAYENLELQYGRVRSFETQVRTQLALAEHNEGSARDAQETEARLAVARADAISAYDQLEIAIRSLAAVTGVRPDFISVWGANSQQPQPMPEDLQVWQERARANNAEVRAAREAVAVADAELSVAQSRFLPTVNLVAALAKADSENLSTLSQKSNTFTIGVQVNIPIFTGGYNSANKARAVAIQRQRQEELDAALEKTAAEVTRQYTAVQSGVERVAALTRAVESSELALQAVREGFRLGVSSNLDVLRMEDRADQARYALITGRLRYLMGQAALYAAAGDLSSFQFDDIDARYLGRVVSVRVSAPGGVAVSAPPVLLAEWPEGAHRLSR